MKLFTLIKEGSVHLLPGKKVIPADDYTTLCEASEIVEKAHADAKRLQDETKEEGERLKEEEKKKGFDEGLSQWNEKLKELEQEIAKVRQDMENSLVPLAMAAVKKIIGREMELRPQTIVDIISTSLKSVSHHKRISLFVNKNDLDLIEQNRPQLKAIFDHLQSLTITPREDVPEAGCIIETEAGIVNVGLENQLQALEKAFHTFLKSKESAP